MEEYDFEVEWLAGLCPVQAEGNVEGRPFYFRARGNRWSFTIAEDPVAAHLGWEPAIFEVEGQYGEFPDAGWMPEEIAYALIVLALGLMEEDSRALGLGLALGILALAWNAALIAGGALAILKLVG